MTTPNSCTCTPNCHHLRGDGPCSLETCSHLTTGHTLASITTPGGFHVCTCGTTECELMEELTDPPQDLSNVSIGGHRLTWKEYSERQAEDIQTLTEWARMVSDLDRNEHGRHEGDIDGSSPSEGNPWFRTGDILGFDIGGRPYRMPPRGLRHDPAAWRSS